MHMILNTFFKGLIFVDLYWNFFFFNFNVIFTWMSWTRWLHRYVNSDRCVVGDDHHWLGDGLGVHHHEKDAVHIEGSAGFIW